jgi:methylated-DNA-[protein]-cysteine S-methyltransferase
MPEKLRMHLLRGVRRRDGGDLPQLRGRAAAPPAPPRQAVTARVDLLTDEIECALGTVVLIARAGRLCGLDYGGGRRRLEAMLAARYPDPRFVAARDPFGFSTRLRAYLAGDLTAIDDILVETGGTPFQRRVWTALRRIPAGRAVAYAALARRVGRPAATRAVGAANGCNPVSIVIPCHRLIGSDASLTGYGGGLWRKRWLLRHEGVALPGRGARGRSRSPRPART